MLSEAQLKEKLQSLAENQFKISDDDLPTLVWEMVNHLGAADSYLRDDLIYAAFGMWILEYDLIEQDLLRELLHTVLSEQQMFHGVGEQNTNSVFRRSFSVLLLPLILINHRANPFLPVADVYKIKEQLLRYLQEEKDLRGFVEGMGWAHAIAHAADALDDLAQCSEITKDDLLDLLEGIRMVVCTYATGYASLEDERLVTAAVAVFQRKLLSDEEIAAWLTGFSQTVLSVDTMPEKLLIRANVKNFLQSLFFRLQWLQVANDILPTIEQTLRKIDLFAQ
ncbi:MAG: DUF2785 domain-containing protein [Chloroflexota bacterium]